MRDWIATVSNLTQKRQDHIIVTLVDIKGSAPQVVGAKMIVTGHGLEAGTVGGGKIENHSIQFAMDMIKNYQDPSLQTWNLQTDIGMSCGGKVSLFFETNYFDKWTIAIFGAGHLSQELVRVISTWSCQVLVFDTRKEWLDKLTQANNICPKLVTEMKSAVKELPRGTFLVSMTQGHATDLPVLVEALKRFEDFKFLGVVGSKVKSRKIKKELQEIGLSDMAIERVQCPIGLDLGDNTPPEIAISIAAQILSIKGSNK